MQYTNYTGFAILILLKLKHSRVLIIWYLNMISHKSDLNPNKCYNESGNCSGVSTTKKEEKYQGSVSIVENFQFVL